MHDFDSHIFTKLKIVVHVGGGRLIRTLLDFRPNIDAAAGSLRENRSSGCSN